MNAMNHLTLMREIAEQSSGCSTPHLLVGSMREQMHGVKNIHKCWCSSGAIRVRHHHHHHHQPSESSSCLIYSFETQCLYLLFEFYYSIPHNSQSICLGIVQYIIYE